MKTLLLPIILLTGCASLPPTHHTGSATLSQNTANQIVEGRTTVAQATKLLGQPIVSPPDLAVWNNRTGRVDNHLPQGTRHILFYRRNTQYISFQSIKMKMALAVNTNGLVIKKVIHE